MRTAFLCLLLLAGFCSADSLTIGGAAPGLALATPAAGFVLADEVDASSTISYATDVVPGSRKITVEIGGSGLDFPAGMRVQVSATPVDGEGAGHTVLLTTSPGDLITDIASLTTVNDVTLTFRVTASLDAPPGSETRTVLFTILMQ
jgi:hypothetical protein